MYISVPFSEMVTVSGTPTLRTEWGTFDYLSGSNVLTFSGAIDADFGTALTVRSLDGTVTDLAGNAFTGGSSVSKSFSGLTVALPWGGSGTQTDPYIITTAAQLDYMAVRVNANTGAENFTGKYFELGADIAYTYTTDWDATANSFENNFTSTGRWGSSFQGHFDGKGHTVSGIRICITDAGSNHDDKSLGRFGYVSGGSVQSVVLRDANISGKTNLGGIVGYLSGGSVSGCTLYHVRVATNQRSDANTDIVVGYNGSSLSGTHYRDCAQSCHLHGQYLNVRQSNVFTLTHDTDVTATYVSGDTFAIDGATYYAEGSAFTLAYTDTLQSASILCGFSATSGTVSPVWIPAWEGNVDSTSDPWLIKTAADLDLLAQMVNGQGGYGYNDFFGAYFQPTDDITYFYSTAWNSADSDENSFTPIGGIAGYNSGEIENCLAVGATIPVIGDYYGVIVGEQSSMQGGLTANYYRGCTAGSTANATGAGVGTSDGTPADRPGARSVHTLTLSQGVDADGESADINGDIYYAVGNAVTLTFSPEEGCALDTLTVTDADNNEVIVTNYAFAMPTSDVTVTANFIIECLTF